MDGKVIEVRTVEIPPRIQEQISRNLEYGKRVREIQGAEERQLRIGFWCFVGGFLLGSGSVVLAIILRQ